MMNIFALDNDPSVAASLHCDQHVNKMLIESTQLLCNAIRSAGIPSDIPIYKPTHVNHPCSIWVRSGRENAQWLFTLISYLNMQYKHRFLKQTNHASYTIANGISPYMSRLAALGQRTPFIQCMPEEYRITENPVMAYRDYYLGEKLKFARWKRGIPTLFLNEYNRIHNIEVEDENTDSL